MIFAVVTSAQRWSRAYFKKVRVSNYWVVPMSFLSDLCATALLFSVPFIVNLLSVLLLLSQLILFFAEAGIQISITSTAAVLVKGITAKIHKMPLRCFLHCLSMFL